VTDIDAINRLRSDYFAAYSTGDVDSIVACVSEATLLNTPTARVQGVAQIRDHYAGMFAGNRMRFLDLTDDVEVGGEFAFCSGRYRLTLMGDAPAERAGRYLVIFKRNAASRYGWSVHRELVQPLPLDAVPHT
jgi:ketosteroid isomerase-like protein